MFGSQQSPDYGDFGSEFDAENQRGRRKGSASMTRAQAKKRSTRKRGSATGAVTGMAHRRRRRWSW